MKQKTILKKSNFILLILAAFLVIFATACVANNEENSSEEDTTLIFEEFTPVVSATGKLVPNQWASLSLRSAGIVVDLKVSENDLVSKGDELLTLSGGVNILATISGANLAIISAEQALQTILDNASLTTAEARAAIAIARDNLDTAEIKLRNLEHVGDQDDIDQAFANMIVAQDNLKKAKDNFENYEDKPVTNVIRASLYSVMIDLQNVYDAKERAYNWITGTANKIDLAKAVADVALSNALLEKAITDLEDLDNGVDTDLLAIANARLQNAQSQLAAAQQALSDLTLTAPFDGTVTQIFIQENEWGNPGQPIMVIGDLSRLEIETTDLNEIDVARIKIGSIATISFDALPGETITGTVIKIATKASAGSGVNYSVIIEMDEVPAGLLWDMTAFIDIEISE